MSEFISNITFGESAASVPTEAQRWQRFADRFVRDVENFLHDNTPKPPSGHCCYCDPQACNPSIPSGDCGEHDYW